MAKATPKDFDQLKLGSKKVEIYHQSEFCNDGYAGRVVFELADPSDWSAMDEFVCIICRNRMAVQWFTAEFAEWVSERYMSNGTGGCECGSAKALGIKPNAIGHSWWCPVAP